MADMLACQQLLEKLKFGGAAPHQWAQLQAPPRYFANRTREQRRALQYHCGPAGSHEVRDDVWRMVIGSEDKNFSG